MVKSTTTKIIAFLAIASTLKACGEGCFACDKTGKCDLCYKSKFDTKNQCTTSGYSSTDPCLIYNQNNKQCAWCQSTAVLDVYFTKCVPAKTKIANCVKRQKVNGLSYCLVCTQGLYPSPMGDKCVALPAGSVPGCKWATRNFVTKKPACVRCQSGYSKQVDAGCV